MSYNLREKIHFVGYCSNQIVATNNLPSIRQVLSTFFYNLRRVTKSVYESAKLTIEECVIIWKKARIPTQAENKCIIKLKAEYERWRNVDKNSTRRSENQKLKEKDYDHSIDQLFDIASGNALQTMGDEQDKTFLLNQRALQRSKNPSSDTSNLVTDEPSPMEVESEGIDIEKKETTGSGVDNDGAANVSNNLLKNDLPKTVSKEILDDLVGSESESPAYQNTPPLKRRATEAVITAKLAVTLDKCKITKRDATHLLMAAAESFGKDTHDLVINDSSIHRARETLRKERYEAIQKLAPNLFSDRPSTIHWDGKLLPGYLRKEISDRLAIIITCGEVEQLLGVPTLTSGTGANQARAVFGALTDWSLVNNVEALCCDSTSSNTGRKNGACVLLEELIDKELLYLICRHHMYELILKCIFEIKFGKSTGPDVPLFREFGEFWKSADTTNYESGIDDTFINEALQNVREEILEFCSEYLKKGLARSDYKEFLELVIIFLGGNLPYNLTFHPPGAIHHARWMAKAIYCLKMFIFRKQFLSNNKDSEMKCRDVCIFIIKVYTKAWFRAPFAALAPNQDLNFLKCLYEYRLIDQRISDGLIKKFTNHLWYLTPQLAALAFFDDNISIEEKLQMCQALQSNDSTFVYEKRVLVNEKNLIDLINSNLCDFICKDTHKFFERFKINQSFLTKHPSKWAKDRDYIYGLEIIRNLKVVNDVAERGVKLMTEFNKLLTKDYKQSQYLLPVINDYRSLFPDSRKETLMQPYI